MTVERKHWLGIDWLRAIAAFGIVGCHLDLKEVAPRAKFLFYYTDLNVGLFALIAGFFMARQLQAKPLRFGGFVASRAARLLPCYLFWTLVFLVFSACFDVLAHHPVFPEIGHLKWWGSVLFQGEAMFHLWFLICLFYAQAVLFPLVFWSVAGPEKKGAILFALGVAGTFLSAVAVAPEWGWFMVYPLRLASFLLIGAGFSSLLPFLARIPKSVCVCALAAGLVAVQFLPWGIYEYARTLVVVLPAFLCAVQADVRSAKMAALGKILGGASMGIYLVHPIFTTFNREIIRLCELPKTLPVVAGDWIFAWGCALGVTLIALRIPRLKKVFV